VPAERRPTGPEGQNDRARLAAEALTAAKQDAHARGDQIAGPGMTRPGSPSATAGAADGGAAAAGTTRGRPRRDDPQRLGYAIGGLLDDHGWQQRAAIGSVFGRWGEIVGPELAAHTQPDAFADGELAVTADSTAWATQVRLLAPQLVRRLNAELGDGTVRRVWVRGPAPPRQRGGWRVPGGRGPRDTYG
jgi:predicted nucleic acid-binding Zn ribbon protein